MVSEKAYAADQRIALLWPGPDVKWNPLRAGWSVRSPFTAAWARFHPLMNSVELSASLATDGAHAADAYQIATMPQYDGDDRDPGRPRGNLLRPAQTVAVGAQTDIMQTTTP